MTIWVKMDSKRFQLLWNQVFIHHLSNPSKKLVTFLFLTINIKFKQLQNKRLSQTDSNLWVKFAVQDSCLRFWSLNASFHWHISRSISHIRRCVKVLIISTFCEEFLSFYISDNGPIWTILKLHCMGKIIFNTLKMMKPWIYFFQLHYIFLSLVVQ